MTNTQKRSNKSKPSPNVKRAPQNIKFGHGDAREGGGRPQRKPLPWPKDTDLTCARETVFLLSVDTTVAVNSFLSMRVCLNA